MVNLVGKTEGKAMNLKGLTAVVKFTLNGQAVVGEFTFAYLTTRVDPH